MIKYKIRDSDWLAFPLIIVNFNHFFIQPAPDCQLFIRILLSFLEYENGDLPSDSTCRDYFVGQRGRDENNYSEDNCTRYMIMV